MSNDYTSALIRLLGLTSLLTGTYIQGGWVWVMIVWGGIIFTPNWWWIRK